MDNIIIEEGTFADEFIKRWLDESDYIEAHTSGSTGSPKPIRLLKSDMRISARNTCEFFGLDDSCCTVLPLSADYIAGKMMIVRAIECGAKLQIERPSNFPLKRCSFGTVDLIPIVPSQIEGLMQSDYFPIVKNVIVGGGKIPVSMEKRLSEVDTANIYATYGMTETCSHVALRKVGAPDYKALPGFRFDVDDRGCLIIESDTMSFRRLVTNDMVRLSDERTFRWLGRYDNVVNSGGIKLMPEQLEAKVAVVLRGFNYYFTSRKSEKWGEELGLVVESDIEIPGLIYVLSQVLDTVERPKFILYQCNFSRTDSGKVIRKKW